jgi:hypothetical protein
MFLFGLPSRVVNFIMISVAFFFPGTAKQSAKT